MITRSACRRRSLDPLPSKLTVGIGEFAVPDNFHVTFHGSGIVAETGGPRTYKPPLAADAVHQLCLFRFQHFKDLPVTTSRSRDTVLPIGLDLSTAVEGKLTLVPEGTVVFFEPKLPQVAIMLEVFDPTGHRLYCVQLSLLHTFKDWPLETEMVWVSKNPADLGFTG